MKYTIVYLISLLVLSIGFVNGQVQKDTIMNHQVKSVFLTRDGIELESPIIRMNSQDKLQISFDLLNSQGDNFRYKFSHCNNNWEKDQLEPVEYINGFEDGSIDNYRNSFTTLQQYTYYYQSFPAEYCTFIASGNYILEVYPQDEPDSIIFRRRFWVCEDAVNIELQIHKPNGASGNINNDQELSIKLNTENLSPSIGIDKYLIVKAQQNGRQDLLRNIPFHSQNNGEMVYSLNQENVFAGGNCFRYFDMSNIHTPMYHVQSIENYGDEIFAFLQPEENKSKVVYTYTKSLNGGCKINIWDRNDPQTEADYVWVNFSLPLQKPFLDGNVYITGELTQWQFNENSRMDWNPKYKAYSKRILLKQGYYAYQLVFVPIGETEGETKELEGDHYETPNDYTVYVYLHGPNDRYDRLVGVNKTTAN